MVRFLQYMLPTLLLILICKFSKQYCSHPEHWKPVVDTNIKDVLDVHSGQACYSLPQRTSGVHTNVTEVTLKKVCLVSL
jgi:hypothetical protein